MNKAVRTRRLKTLYQVMGGIPASVINMDNWRNDQFCGNPDDTELIDSAKTSPGCGTTACALGWACAYPTFKRAGLQWGKYRQAPQYDDKTNFEAGAAFFGITEGQAEALFSPTYGSNVLQGNHKKTFLKRLRNLMVDLEIITEERSLELWAEEALETE